MNLNVPEICMIKGLLRHKKMNQQQIIATFSRPDRTVHHNVVSEIACGIRFGDDASYPPTVPATCDKFLGQLPNDWEWRTSYSISTLPAPFHFTYSYHPVGQGMFCSGSFTRRHQAPFRWVYDCGTEQGFRNPARRNHIRREIAFLADEQSPAAGQRPRMDLVTLSHFDEDHLSGLLDLLSTFSIGTLLLPYLTPWDRLIVALDRNASVGSDFLDFLLEPTAFLLERSEGEVERILLIPPSGEGSAFPPLTTPEETPPVDDILRSTPDVEFKSEAPERENPEEAAGEDSGLLRPNTRMLPPGAAITVSRAWEFLPYNDMRLAGLAKKSFKALARSHAKKLIRSASTKNREAALEKIRKLYDAQFKTPRSKKISASRRNLISLFLYSGPVGAVVLQGIAESVLRHRLAPMPMRPPFEWLGDERFGQMFTGDGYLQTVKQLAAYEKFFVPYNRLKRSAFFQVMHHGAKANWQPGIARKLNPRASIFCSDPSGKNRHPSHVVLSDFAAFNPKQVDAFHGLKFEGRYRFF